MIQLTLNLGIVAKKRIRYKVPKCLNFYTLYQYDRNKFRELLREWLKTPDGMNRTLETLEKKQNEILEECFILDEHGNKLRDSDQTHIYRYQTLHRIMQEIYNCVKWEYIKTGSIFSVKGLTILQEDEQAEIQGTELETIKNRIKIHIRLLRLLRKGLSVKDCMKKIKGAIKKAPNFGRDID
jgi:hypothetical protein